MKKILTALFCASLSASLLADDNALIAQMKVMGFQDIELKDSPLPQIKTAVTERGIFYISEDGKYILDGKLYHFSKQGLVDAANVILLDKLNSYKKEMIVYPAQNEKYVVTVFMDSTCHYCRLLHKQLKEYNDLGITVRYLAFPRGGLDNKTAREMEAVWTSADPAFALEELLKGNPPKTLKNAEMVKKHYELGLQFGVTGTPTIVTQKGEVIGGYLKPQDLLMELAH